MREAGKVVKTEGKYATVRIDKKEECAKCGLCLFSGNAQFTTLRAHNAVGAKSGDDVIVENSGGGKLLGALLVFLVPLLLIGAATLFGLFVIKKEIWILLLSLIFILSWYTILGFFDKKLRNSDKLRTVIVEIIPTGDCENDNNNEQERVL